MRKALVPFALIGIVGVAAVDGVAFPGSPQKAASEEQTTPARELLAAQRVLSTADVKTIQAAVRSALAGKYAVQRGVGPTPAGGGQDGDHEYLLDEQARIVFHRYQQRDTARPGVTRYTILEFTNIPAVRCVDRSALPGRRLGFTYYEDSKGWHLGNPMVVNAEGSPWAIGSPGYDFLHAAPESLRDIGVRQIQGRAARGLRIAGVPEERAERTVWIDTVSVLPIQETIGGTLGGKQMEISTQWSYPPPRPIARPKDISPPDCA